MTYLNFVWDGIVNKLGGSVFVGNFGRQILYKLGGVNLKTRQIRPSVFLYSNKLTVDEGSFINKGCFFYNVEEISIGKNVYLAPEVFLCTNSHHIGDETQRAGEMVSEKIIIGDGSWIGARAMIMPGVKVGKGVVIAAGAVVTKDCEDNSVYAGVPAKKIKDLPKDTPQKPIAV